MDSRNTGLVVHRADRRRSIRHHDAVAEVAGVQCPGSGERVRFVVVEVGPSRRSSMRSAATRIWVHSPLRCPPLNRLRDPRQRVAQISPSPSASLSSSATTAAPTMSDWSVRSRARERAVRRCRERGRLVHVRHVDRHDDAVGECPWVGGGDGDDDYRVHLVVERGVGGHPYLAGCAVHREQVRARQRVGQLPSILGVVGHHRRPDGGIGPCVLGARNASWAQGGTPGRCSRAAWPGQGFPRPRRYLCPCPGCIRPYTWRWRAGSNRCRLRPACSC